MTVERYLMEALKTAPVYVEDVFSTYLYTGNGATQTITNNIDLSTKGGMVWIKGRDFATAHMVFDTARGVEKYISTNLTSAQNYNGSPPSFYTLGSFNNDGFTLSGDGGGAVNTSSRLYCSWTFRKQPKFFDVVTYTGTGSARTIAHSLGATPGMIIVKRTDTTSNWQVYHIGLTSAANSIQLNLTAAQASAPTVWNSTAPTSTVFSVGTDATVNANGGTYVAYIYANQAGGFGLSGSDSVVACGSFTADGSGNATVNLGWEPQFLIAKATGATNESWMMVDTMRGWNNAQFYLLYANLTNAEGSASVTGNTPTATGFTFTGSITSASQTYIYLAIRRGPMKVPTSGTSVFSPVVYSGNNAARTISAGFVPDVVWFADRSATYWGQNTTIFDRLRGLVYSVSSGTGAEASLTPFVTAFGQAGINITNSGMNNASNIANGYLDYFFGRAPGYMDVVCYTGTGVARTVTHNLGVVPELIIVKPRSAANPWLVYAAPVGATNSLVLSGTQAAFSASYWNDTAPTSTVFSIGSGPGSNQNGITFVAYLFATCPGVSKVGSYIGTGAAQNINCGFSAGARFVLIKRTDSTGSWYVWDSARGISSGNDPYLLLNSTASEVTGTNYVDTFASGFTLTASAPAGLNANGGSYIFLAVA